MKKRNWIKITSIYIGTVIGAGFASGREIIEFFGVYGVKGIWGILISGILFSMVGSLLLIIIYNNKISNFNELVIYGFGKKFGFLLDTIMIFSLYTGFSIMVSGSGAIFKEELGLSFNTGIIFMIVCTFIVIIFSLEGLSLINSLLVPLLIVGIIFTSMYLSLGHGNSFSNAIGANFTSKGNFLISSFLYFGSNSLIMIIVFSSLLPIIDSRKTALLGGCMGGIILFMLGLSILIPMLIYYNDVSYLDIPMLKICNYIGKGYRKIYAMILWIAMFTTALANGFGFMNRMGRSKGRVVIGVIFCISAIPLAKMGFANLVSIIYPAFGAIGLGIMLSIFLGK